MLKNSFVNISTIGGFALMVYGFYKFSPTLCLIVTGMVLMAMGIIAGKANR